MWIAVIFVVMYEALCAVLTLQISHAMRLFSHLFDCHANTIGHLVMKKDKKRSFSFPAGAGLWLTVTCPRRYRAGTQQLPHDQ